MSDLVTRILDCVPPGTYALHGLLRLVDVAESDEVPTAAIVGGAAPRMLVNPAFAGRYAATPERLLMLVMHELHHVILGHTRLLPVSTALDNVVFDAVINALLCRAFPDPRGIALLTDFYAPDEVPAALLRPADGWQPDRPGAAAAGRSCAAGHPRLADVHRALYSPGRRQLRGAARGARSRRARRRRRPERRCSAGTSRAASTRAASRSGPRSCSTSSATIVESWPQPPDPIRGRSIAAAVREAFAPPRRVAGNRARLRALLRWAGGLSDRGTVRAVGPVETAVAHAPAVAVAARRRARPAGQPDAAPRGDRRGPRAHPRRRARPRLPRRVGHPCRGTSACWRPPSATARPSSTRRSTPSRPWSRTPRSGTSPPAGSAPPAARTSRASPSTPAPTASAGRCS